MWKFCMKIAKMACFSFRRELICQTEKINTEINRYSFYYTYKAPFTTCWIYLNNALTLKKIKKIEGVWFVLKQVRNAWNLLNMNAKHMTLDYINVL